MYGGWQMLLQQLLQCLTSMQVSRSICTAHNNQEETRCAAYFTHAYLSLMQQMTYLHDSGAQFTKYLTIYRKFIVRSTYDSDLKRVKTSFRNIVS